MKGIPSNRYKAVDATVCSEWQSQYGTHFTFPKLQCLLGKCENCGVVNLKTLIETENHEMISQNKNITWCKWAVPQDKSTPVKCQIRGTLKNAVDKLITLLVSLKSHLFRANWNRNIFDYSRNNLKQGQVVQIFDFAMNYRNWYQDEIQSAYWDGTQTAIHAVINYYLCPNQGCTEVVTSILAQILEDLHHDSFMARAGHDVAFKHLAQLSIPMDLVIQFCDNCSSQYKSRRPFAELACCSIPIVRIFFSENHGKSYCDAFFGRLKSWMSYKIKARHVIINDANDFFRYCKAEYETPEIGQWQCQHYKVTFLFLCASDICRHHDCNLKDAVTGTRRIYSVRNSPHPLKLKICNIPCSCTSCLLDNQEHCKNSNYADPWREVDLIPMKGQSMKTHMKCKHPRDCVNVNPPLQQKANNRDKAQDSDSNDSSEGDDVPDIQIVSNNERENEENDTQFIDLTEQNKENLVFIDLTSNQKNNVTSSEQNEDMLSFENIEEDDVLINEDAACPWKENGNNKKNNRYEGIILELQFELESNKDDIPDSAYWENILGSLESCTNERDFEVMAKEIAKTLRPLPARKQHIHFRVEKDFINSVALNSIPDDGPQDFDPIKILTDGNCLPHTLSHGSFGTDAFHLQICTHCNRRSIK